jgi:alpha-L-rhamnosidase
MNAKTKSPQCVTTRIIFSFAQALCLIGLSAAIFCGPASAADKDLSWPAITRFQKPWAFWWWMGSAVDKTNITKELTRYRDAGLGGVHIIPIYGAKGWEDKYINYLSPQWMEMMGWSVSEAHRLGMDVDMTTGTGWCFGGPQITDQDANASVVVKTYDLGLGERLKEKFKRESTQALVAFGPDGKSIDLTDSITTNGEVLFSPPGNWTGTNSPPKTWTIYAISQKPSGQKVKRPAPGGEGWMLNLIYPPAIDDFLKPFTAAFANYHGPKPRAQYHDSYEYRSDWSPSFFAEFEKRRGYKLQTELPALFGTSNDDHSARVKCDYRQTVSEIMAEESLPAWTKWSHDHGFITRNQAHGSPGNWLDLYAAADIPETEMFHSDRSKLISKFASSAAHVTGKPLVSSETGTWLEEHFTEKLSDVKYLFDDMFLSGINHMFYHGCCYSPDEAGWPGWHFYASTEMNPRNSIWHDADAVNAYAARCQSILQSGAPDNDILLYWPIEDFWMQPGDKLLPQLTVHARDWFEGQPIGRAAKELWDRGYAFDYVSDDQLSSVAVFTNKISMKFLNGTDYETLVVPKCKFIPIVTFSLILGFVQRGGTVIFLDGLPEDVSGLNHVQGNHLDYTRNWLRKMEDVAKDIAQGKMPCRGKIFIGDLSSVLHGAKISRENLADSGLSFVRRSFAGGWHYFIANRTETNFDGWITLARPAKSVVILNPMTGNSAAASRNKVGQIHLQLAAGESIILRAFEKKKVKGPAWNYWQTNGQPVEITGQWNVKFILGGPTLPADFQTAKLASWTTFPDTNTQAFAGTAKYETTFDAPQLEFNLQVAPDTLKRELQPCFLDLGDVRQSARVRVNGKDYGTLITPPFRVVVNNLKPTGNKLEVEVTNVSANRIRDLDRRGVKWKTFYDINFVNLNYRPFDASNWPLTDSGLLGPVTLAPGL